MMRLNKLAQRLSLCAFISCTALTTLALSPTASAAACAPAWQEGSTYSVGQVVSYLGNNYKALQAHTAYVGAGWNPAAATTLWTLTGSCSGSTTPKPTATPAPPPTPQPTASPKPTATPVPTPTATPVPGGFKHPGVLVDLTQLQFIKQQVLAKVEPYATAYAKARDSSLGSLTYTVLGPPSDHVVDCGASSNPDHGCSEEKQDASAAYTQALLWYISGNEQYAKNAIAIMNRWARDLTKGHTNSNAPLQSAWAAENWPAAAEIIRYTYSGWSSADIQTFQRMLNDQYLPYISGNNLYTGKNGNWSLSMADAMLGIAVFNNDRTTYNAAIAAWKQWVPGYIYNASLDGGKPVTFSGGPGSWNGQTVFNASTSGVSQETCRDTQHVALGMAALFNGAETAYLQGDDLYTPNKVRLTTTLEYHARMLQGVTNTSQDAKFPVPAGFPGLCNGQYTPVLKATMERGYNAYHTRMGVDLPQTWKHLVNDVRPKADPNDEHDVIWETLTHGTTN
ncbi:carbohydrate-binding protein [Andreprevotia chitinilytica]|uniref:carbohydrate-binding protein n=1 Tax=Andreprevotia chitinilytica TaxID=396808 RepID=UPI000AD70B12|nr:carbohydrate-binding protein [Andreprevotia chitinilytica]